MIVRRISCRPEKGCWPLEPAWPLEAMVRLCGPAAPTSVTLGLAAATLCTPQL